MGRAEDVEEQPTIVIVTSDGPEHHYVANRILEDFEVSAIIVDRGRPQTRAERVRVLRKRFNVGQLFSRLMLRFTALLFRDEQRRERDLYRVLGRKARAFARPDLVRHVDGINTPDGGAVIRDVSPDFLLVYGTGIVGPKVLAMARVAALNLHTGISPDYRGSESAFWPVFNREYELLGATIHECTDRIDGGEIYARARAEPHPDDGQFAVFARCVLVGADLYVSTLRRALDRPLEGQRQDPTVGKEYRAVDKRLRHDLAVRWVFRSGEFQRDAVAASASSLSSPGRGPGRPAEDVSSPSSDADPRSQWPSVSVTIVNHRSRDLLRACLDSLRRYPYTLGVMEVVVLDNASDDGSVEMLRDEYSEVVVLAERTRRGYAANQNRAVAASHGDVIFMLNPDAVVHEFTVDRLVEALDWDEDVAITGGPIANDDGTLRQDRPHPFPTPLGPYTKAFGLLRIRGLAQMGKQVVSDGWPSGGAYLIERGAFNEVGGFDEDFFMYAEDADLFARLVARGYLVAWVDDAIVTHPYRDEPAELRARRQAEVLNAEFQHIRKHYGRAGLYRVGVIVDASLRIVVLSLPGLSRVVKQHGKTRSYTLQVQQGRLAAALFGDRKPRLADLADEWNRSHASQVATTGSEPVPREHNARSAASSSRSIQNLIVFDSSTRWDGPWMAFQHIALQLAKYAPVLFVDAPQSPVFTYREYGRPRVRSRLQQLDTNLYRLTPAAPPGLTRTGIHHLTGIAVRRAVASAIAELDADVHAFFCSMSHTNIFNVADAAVRVYYVSDDFQAAAELIGRPRARIAALDEQLAGEADAIVAISPSIADSYRDRGYEPLLVPNGVDTDAFRDVESAPPPDDVTLPRPIAGYIGHISDRIDMTLVEAVAASGMSVLLVGPLQWTFGHAERFAGLLARPNVQWVGPKRFDELPSYLRVIDVGLVPYTNSAFNQASFPLKTLEYLAAGRPVVATPLPSIRWLDTPLISMADSPDEFARMATEEARRSGPLDLVAERRSFAAGHSWSERVKELVTILKLDQL